MLELLTSDAAQIRVPVWTLLSIATSDLGISAVCEPYFRHCCAAHIRIMSRNTGKKSGLLAAYLAGQIPNGRAFDQSNAGPCVPYRQRNSVIL